MTTELIQQNALLSTFANLAYKDSPPDNVNGWVRMDAAPGTASGFSAVAYRGPNGEVAIAMRGTDSLRDLVPDSAFVVGAWNQQFSDAAKFVADVKLEMAAKGLSGLPLVTGHSLGGGIAQVVGKMFGLEGAAFDAPGALGVTQSAGFALTAAQYGQATNNAIGPDFINYNSQGSLISAAGTQIGQSQSLVSLTDPSLAPLLIGSLGMLGSPILGLLGFAAVGDIVSTHPSGGIERAMWVTATLTKALDAGSIQMSTMSWTEATGSTWPYEGSPQQVPVFKDSEGKLIAVVAKDGDSLTISTPDQSTIVRMRTSVDVPVLECTIERNGAPAMSCDISQQNESSVDLKITAFDNNGSAIGSVDVVCDGEEWVSNANGDVAVLDDLIPEVWNRGGASDPSFMDNEFFPTDEQLLADLLSDGELENPTPVIAVKIYINRVLAYDGDVGVNIRNFPAPIIWGDGSLHRVTIFVAGELYIDEYHEGFADAIHLGERAVASHQWNPTGQPYQWDTFARPGWFDFVSNMADDDSSLGSDTSHIDTSAPLKSDAAPDICIINGISAYADSSEYSINTPATFDEYSDFAGFELPPIASLSALPAMFAQPIAAAGTERVALSLVNAMAQFSAGAAGTELSIRADESRYYNGVLLAAA